METAKYVLPVILFPFWSLFYYAFSQFKGKPKQEVKFSTVDSTSINPAIPDVGSDVSSNNLPDKFKAFQDTYKQQADSTAVKSLSPDNFQHSYEQEAAEEKSKRFLDSMTLVMNRHNAEFSAKMGETDRLRSQPPPQRQPGLSQPKTAPPTKWNLQKQMAIIDSMQRARQESLNPLRQNKPAPAAAPDTVKAFSVVKADASEGKRSTQSSQTRKKISSRPSLTRKQKAWREAASGSVCWMTSW